MKNWNAQRTALSERLADGRRYASDKTIEVVDLPNFLEAVIRLGDRVCLEGDNQKQADVLAASLANVDPAKVRELHMVQSGVVLPEHLDVLDKGICIDPDAACHRAIWTVLTVQLAALHSRQGRRDEYRSIAIARSGQARAEEPFIAGRPAR